MKRRKRNKTIKKWQNYLFVILVIVIGVLLFIFKDKMNNFINPKQSDIKDKTEVKKEEENKEEVKEEAKTETKIDTTSYKKTSNYKSENLNRYIAYKNSNPSYDYEKVVTYVNIGLDRSFYSYIGSADLTKGVTILMNKYLKLPDGYEPDDLEEISSEYFINGNTLVRKLRKEAKESFERLSKDSIANGTPVYGQSAFRPYSMQQSLYNNAVNSMGQAAADNDTARPGHSEHQTGLAIDVSNTKGGNMMNFSSTSSYTWMQNNAYKYGFILRYTKGYESIHGFMYEGWHYRYVGVNVATNIHNNYPNMTYDEYYYKFID